MDGSANRALQRILPSTRPSCKWKLDQAKRADHIDLFSGLLDGPTAQRVSSPPHCSANQAYGRTSAQGELAGFGELNAVRKPRDTTLGTMNGARDCNTEAANVPFSATFRARQQHLPSRCQLHRASPGWVACAQSIDAALRKRRAPHRRWSRGPGDAAHLSKCPASSTLQVGAQRNRLTRSSCMH